MTIDEYNKLFNTKVWRARNPPFYQVREGMILFDESASHIGGFAGDYIYFCLNDYSNFKEKLHDKNYYRYSHHYFPRRLGFKAPAVDEKHWEKRFGMMTVKEQNEYTKRMNENYIDFPTVEYPVWVYLGGIDDSSYSKFFPTLKEANEELDLLLACQPLNFANDISGRYVFTN